MSNKKSRGVDKMIKTPSKTKNPLKPSIHVLDHDESELLDDLMTGELRERTGAVKVRKLLKQYRESKGSKD